jgi:hypothetical protein
MGRQSYVGLPKNMAGCAKQMVAIEGTFDAISASLFLYSTAIHHWRVVAATPAPHQAVVETKRTLPAFPDPDMVRIPAGQPSNIWQSGGATTMSVGVFDVDRDEFSLGAVRALAAEGRLPMIEAGLSLQSRALDERPVVCVSASDAAYICHALGKRLPSEAEWARSAEDMAEREEPLHASQICHGSAILACTERRMPNEASEEASCDGSSLRAGAANAAEKDDVSTAGVTRLAGGVEEWTESPYCTTAWGCLTFDRVVRGGYAGAPSVWRRVLGEAGHIIGPSPRRGFRCAR